MADSCCSTKNTKTPDVSNNEEVYLLDKGECEVLVADRSSNRSKVARIEQYVVVGTRRKGDFVGEITMAVSDRHLNQVKGSAGRETQVIRARYHRWQSTIAT